MTARPPLELITVPPIQSSATVELVDRRTQHRWTVEVAPFRLGATPVTAGLYGQVTGRDVPAGDEGCLRRTSRGAMR